MTNQEQRAMWRDHKRKFREQQKAEGKCLACGYVIADPQHAIHHAAYYQKLKREPATPNDPHEIILRARIAAWQKALEAYLVAKSLDELGEKRG